MRCSVTGGIPRVDTGFWFLSSAFAIGLTLQGKRRGANEDVASRVESPCGDDVVCFSSSGSSRRCAYGLGAIEHATVLGTVRDASGAVVAGASLTARNVDTN